MDTRLKYQDIIKNVLQKYADRRSNLGDGYTSQVLFDDERSPYCSFIFEMYLSSFLVWTSQLP
jgi:hypothetical protein